jgi:hypothetical protein
MFANRRREFGRGKKNRKSRRGEDGAKEEVGTRNEGRLMVSQLHKCITHM